MNKFPKHYFVRVQIHKVYELDILADSEEHAEQIVEEMQSLDIYESGNLLDVTVDNIETYQQLTLNKVISNHRKNKKNHNTWKL